MFVSLYLQQQFCFLKSWNQTLKSTLEEFWYFKFQTGDIQSTCYSLCFCLHSTSNRVEKSFKFKDMLQKLTLHLIRNK